VKDILWVESVLQRVQASGPKHRVDSMAAMLAMVREGLGVSILPCYTADLDPALARLDSSVFRDPKFDIWILNHPDARRTRRLRLFADFLVKRIKADVELFEGRRGIHDNPGL